MRNYPSLQSPKICRDIRATRPEAIICINNEISKPGETKMVRPGETITLDDRHSYSGETITLYDRHIYYSDNKSLDFEWKKTYGPKVILNGTESSELFKISNKKRR